MTASVYPGAIDTFTTKVDGVDYPAADHINYLQNCITTLESKANGWTPVADTWTYASATTINVPSGAASLYQVGDKIMLTQTTVKKFYIVGVADTLLTVTAGSNFTVANAAITLPFYSHMSNPLGFPANFDLTAPTWTTTGTAFTNQPGTNAFAFSIVGGILSLTGTANCNATSGGTGHFIATFATGQLPVTQTNANGSSGNNNTALPGWCYLAWHSLAVQIASASGSTLAANSEAMGFSISYPIA